MFPPHNEVPPIRRSPKAMAMAVPPWLGSSLLVYVGVGLARQRWGGTEGHLLLDDECLSSTTERSGDPSAEPLPWSTVTDLRVRPLLLWGRCQQGHITAWRRGGQPLHLLVERPE